ncbi:hypothetical protein F0562_017859 [Nyssa sinensis]|uniref:AAA+ ATPase domain-containing protein n=1 Tax=Nyssa sinensis TaxID=561372 RepID=A0A5J4ZJW8_9ASTE|nr:hypothetical protein F0562_017859 [Nyssa sinensis]
MTVSAEMWLGITVGGLMFIWGMFQKFFLNQFHDRIGIYGQKLVNLASPYHEITFNEYTGDRFERSNAYTTIETYLGANSSARAKRLKADMVRDGQSLILSMDDREERNYKLTFHKRHRDFITKSYLNHVMAERKAIAVRMRQRRLYTNNRSEQWHGYKRTMWSHVEFDHPAKFETLALEPKKKQEILNDLITFSKAKQYAKIGKAWKRGYLLYGPPGTGKSTMAAAMANLLQYDVYDLELTAVKDNTELRKLLIDTSSKSIIVIEDIDCSLDLTGQRKKEKKKDEGEEVDQVRRKKKDEDESTSTKVTLSGLLNFIDGLWSACGSERLIVFTTNFVEKLDPALIRRGRMDKHIKLSYCSFEAFKVLAKNYLDLDSHKLFTTISCLLGETNITPADVAENLMPKSAEDGPQTCLENLIKALETAKEEARLKDEEEERLKAEKEQEGERLKAEKEEKEKEQKRAEEVED